MTNIQLVELSYFTKPTSIFVSKTAKRCALHAPHHLLEWRHQSAALSVRYAMCAGHACTTKKELASSGKSAFWGLYFANARCAAQIGGRSSTIKSLLWRQRQLPPTPPRVQGAFCAHPRSPHVKYVRRSSDASRRDSSFCVEIKLAFSLGEMNCVAAPVSHLAAIKIAAAAR